MGSYIDHFVRVEVESDNGIVAFGMCGLFFDAEAVAFTVELPVGFLERDSAIFKHKLDIALAALSVLPLHSAQGRSPNSRRRWLCALLRRYRLPLVFLVLLRSFASTIDRKVIGDSSNSKNDFRHIGRLSVMMDVLFRPSLSRTIDKSAPVGDRGLF